MALILFDIDGTLIRPYMDNTAKTRDFAQIQVLPNVRETLQTILAAGDTVCLITNQGGVAFGHTTEAAVYAKLTAVVQQLGLATAARFHTGTAQADAPAAAQATDVYVCFAHRHASIAAYRAPALIARRKPRPTMVREAIAQHPEAAAQGVLVVGDRPEDKGAAHDAQVPFQWASAYFSWEQDGDASEPGA